MASVRKLNPKDPKSKWVVEYTDAKGVRRRETPKSGLKKDADAIRRRIESELDDGSHISAYESVTFGQAADAWLAHVERRWKIGDGVTGYTFEGWKSCLKNHVRPAFADRLIKELKTRDFQEFILEKRVDYAPDTCRRMIGIIHGICDIAADKEWLKINPLKVKTLRLPAESRKEKAIPNKDEIRLILEAIAEREPGMYRYAHINRVALIVLALFAGMRKGEICGLQWENVDFSAGLLHVRHSLSPIDGLKGPKTKAGRRSIPMSAPVRQTLEWMQRETGAETGFVISTPHGEPRLDPRNVYRNWQAIMTKAGLLKEDGKPKYTFHALRHAAVSLLIQQGLDAFVLKGIIGHSSVTVTLNVYGHMFPDDKRGEAAIFGAANEFAFQQPRLEKVA